MVEINKEAFKKMLEKREELFNRVDQLVARNSTIGNEATLKDVLGLFKEFDIPRSSDMVRTRVINQVLGGGN